MQPLTSPRRSRHLVLMLITLSLIAAMTAGATTSASAAPKKPRLFALCGTAPDNWLEGTTRPVTASVFTSMRNKRNKPIKGITVTIQRNIEGRWTKVAKGRTNSHGNFRVKVVLQTAGPLMYRCKLTISKKFKALRKLKTLTPVTDTSTVDRRSTATLAVQGSSDGRTTFIGRVTPAGPGRFVRVSVQPQDVTSQYRLFIWEDVDIPVNPDGTFTFSRELAGRFIIQADVARSTDYSGFTKATLFVNTVSNDGL